MRDFEAALEEVKPTFGVSEEEIKGLVHMDMINYGNEFTKIIDTITTLIKNLENNTKVNTTTVLLEGNTGTGKTALAAHIALSTKFPFVKLIAPEMYIGLSEAGKAEEIARVFDLAYKSPLSVILIDNIERHLEYVPIGPRFSNTILQALLILLKRPHPHPGRKLFVIATTSSYSALRDLQLKQAFNVIITVPQLHTVEQVVSVMKSKGVVVDPMSGESLYDIASTCVLPISIKQLLMVIDMAIYNENNINIKKFGQCLDDCGLVRFNINDPSNYE